LSSIVVAAAVLAGSAKAGQPQFCNGLEPLAGVLALSEIQDVSQSVVKIDPEIMSGAPCFAGTRVPIQNLIDYLEGGDSIEDFLEGFPSVSREQVIAFLEEAKECMLAAAAK
jgi:uncharacterized protein (DUF433 family)